MIDIIEELKAIHREVAVGRDTVTVVIRRNYSAAIEDAWDALTDPARVRR
jgi:hypothetical protein